MKLPEDEPTTGPRADRELQSTIDDIGVDELRDDIRCDARRGQPVA